MDRRWYRDSALSQLHPDALHRLTDVLLPPWKHSEAAAAAAIAAASASSQAKSSPGTGASLRSSASRSPAPRPFEMLVIGTPRTRTERAAFVSQVISFLDSTRREAYTRADTRRQVLGAASTDYRIEVLDMWDCPIDEQSGAAAAPVSSVNVLSEYAHQLESCLRGDFRAGYDHALHHDSSNAYHRMHTSGSPPYRQAVVIMMHVDEANNSTCISQMAQIVEACRRYGVQLPKDCPVSGLFLTGVSDVCTAAEYLPVWSCLQFHTGCTLLSDACKLPLSRFFPWRTVSRPEELTREEFVLWASALTAPLIHALDAARKASNSKKQTAAPTVASLSAHIQTLSFRVSSLQQWCAYAEQRKQQLMRASDEERQRSGMLAAPPSPMQLAASMQSQLSAWVLLYECSQDCINQHSEQLLLKVRKYTERIQGHASAGHRPASSGPKR